MEQIREKVTPRQYKIIKERAYRLAAELSEKDLTKEEYEEIVNETSFLNEDEQIIYRTTVLYPNDIEILRQREIGRESGNKNNINYLCKELNIPFNIMIAKMREYQNYDIIGLLTSNPELAKLTEQAPFIDIQKPKKHK